MDNLFKNQHELNFDGFTLVALEAAYLKNHEEVQYSGNESSLRSFMSWPIFTQLS